MFHIKMDNSENIFHGVEMKCELTAEIFWTTCEYTKCIIVQYANEVQHRKINSKNGDDKSRKIEINSLEAQNSVQ